jgi:hypothetical protein
MARRLRLWWGLSEFEGFEEIVEVRFVLVHPYAVFQGGRVQVLWQECRLLRSFV